MSNASVSNDVVDRFSLNQMTINQWDMRQCIEGCVEAGVPAVGLWRHKIDEIGLKETVNIVESSGIHVSSLCRGGMFPAATAAARQARIDDNKKAIDEAAAIGTDLLVLVCGPSSDRDIDRARGEVQDGIEAIIPYAAERGVKLGIEPLHPMFAADRSVIVSLKEANDMAVRIGDANVGVVIDVYHVWWDPFVYEAIEQSKGRIFAFHVNDWIVPLPDPLNGRGVMGDGSIEIQRLRKAVDAAGYTGPIEVEIFNEHVWRQPGQRTLNLMVDRFRRYV